MDQPLTTASAATEQAASPEWDRSSSLRRATAPVRALGAARLLVLAATTLALLGLFRFLPLRVAEPHYTLLYGNLELEDSSVIVGRPEALGVPFRLPGDGRALLVPADQALRLRMTLAGEGLPRGDFGRRRDRRSAERAWHHRLPRQRQPAPGARGRLARTIASLAELRSARVHLMLPRRELFRRQQIAPSASITLHMYGGRRLDRRQVQTVRRLDAAAVPALVPERIALVDDQGTLLARGSDGDPKIVVASQADELRQAYEARRKWTVEHLLERCFGPGPVRLGVTMTAIVETEPVMGGGAAGRPRERRRCGC